MRALVGVLLFALVGCGASEVHLTIDLDPAIDPAQVARLKIEVPADSFSYDQAVPASAFDGRRARVVYRARGGGTIGFQVTTLDGAGQPFGYGESGAVDVPGHGSVDAHVLVAPGVQPGSDMTVGGDGGGDAAVPDLGGILGGPSRCSSLTGVLFCEGFENTTLAGWNGMYYQPPGGGALAMLDTSQAARGAQSLLAHMPAVDPADLGGSLFTKAAMTRDQTLLPPFFVRLFVRLPTTPLPNVGGDNMFLFLRQINSPYAHIHLALHADGLLALDTSSEIYPQPEVDSTKLLPMGQWSCIEVGVTASADGGAPGVQVWVDEVERPELFRGPLTLSAPIAQVEVGITASYQSPQPSADLWFDEIVAANQRIGCSQ